jgi:hypothetical protein
MYRAKPYSSTEIEQVTVIGVTEHFVTIQYPRGKYDTKDPQPRREKRVKDGRCTLCDTWEQAHARMIKAEEQSVKSDERTLEAARKLLERVRAMTKPKGM